MNEKYYISSTKANIQERQTKLNGKVYDIRFRVILPTGEETYKKLSGYKSKALAKQAHIDFITKNCEIVKNLPLKKEKSIAEGKEELTVESLIPIYLTSMVNQNKDSTIYDRANVLNNFVFPS